MVREDLLLPAVVLVRIRTSRSFVLVVRRVREDLFVQQVRLQLAGPSQMTCWNVIRRAAVGPHNCIAGAVQLARQNSVSDSG